MMSTEDKIALLHQLLNELRIYSYDEGDIIRSMETDAMFWYEGNGEWSRR